MMSMDVQAQIDNYRAELDAYPPAPVVWGMFLLDFICKPLHCANWRESLDPSEASWLRHEIPSVLDRKPWGPTYQEFLQEQVDPEASTLQSLYAYAFETPSTALADIVSPTGLFVAFFLMLICRWIKSLLCPIFSSWGRRAGRETHGAKWEEENEERIVKFGEYIFRLIFHSLLSIYGVWYFRNKEWWDPDSLTASLGQFRDYPVYPVMPGMIWYYLVQQGYNLDAMVTLLEESFDVRFRSPWNSKNNNQNGLQSPIVVSWSETVRSDFHEMFAHHVITNALILFSSFLNFERTGSIVFLLHDISDIPIDVSKLANFLKWKVTTIICFCTMNAVWVVARLYLLPKMVYLAFINVSPIIMRSSLIPPILYKAFYPIFNVLLLGLILLHVFWFGMFLQMWHTLITKNKCQDYSEKNDQGVDTTSTANKKTEDTMIKSKDSQNYESCG